VEEEASTSGSMMAAPAVVEEARTSGSMVAAPAHILYGDPIIRSECTYRYRSCEPADLWIRSDCYAVRSDPTASISLTFAANIPV